MTLQSNTIDAINIQRVTWLCNSIQLFHTFLCTCQNYHTQSAVDDPMHQVIHSTEVIQRIEWSGSVHWVIHNTEGQCDSFDCCTEKYELGVLLPNSELTKGNNKRAYGSFSTEDHGGCALSTPNNLVVCGQKHKMWVLVFWVIFRGTIWSQNWTA